MATRNTLSTKNPEPPQQSSSRRRSSSSRRNTTVPVVGIGASAGGLSALKNLFSHMPPDSGAAFVVIVHRSPDHKSLLPTLLAKETLIPVHEITDTATIQPNHIYVAHPGGHLFLHGRLLKVKKNHPQTTALQFPIDSFFMSLAKRRRSKAIGIILSGTGTDGTLGVKAIRTIHGLTIAQEEGSAEFSAMPHHAISMGFIDHILQVEDMPKTILQFLGRVSSSKTDFPAVFPQKKFPQHALKSTLSLIHTETGHNYTLSDFPSIPMKLQRRMQLKNYTDLKRYNEFLLQHPEEVSQLSRDILSSHAQFFRDASSLKDLEKAFVRKFKNRPSHEPVRVWVAGCSISEEAYSIAILLHECCQQFSPPLSYKVFATDLDAHAIEQARSGRFPPTIEGAVGSQRLEKYFVKRHQQWIIRKPIREHLVFSVHDVFSDPPFIQLDALCCRNLFMPTEQAAQKQLLHLFHIVLKPKGILFLSTDKLFRAQHDTPLFTAVNKQKKLFQRSSREKEQPRRRRTPTREQSIPSFPSSFAELDRQKSFVPNLRKPSNDYPQAIEDVLLKYHVPPTVLTTMNGDLVYMYGNTSPYFKNASNELYTSLNLLELIRSEFKSSLNRAFQQMTRHIHFLPLNNLSYEADGIRHSVDILIRRLSHPPRLRDLLLITFDAFGDNLEDSQSTHASTPQTKDKKRKLNREIQVMRRSLQTTIEELEVASEEMNETYEEIQSANEELYSMNAELESSKQETQALNEELQMINVELQEKLDDLARAEDHFRNIINGTQVATLFLDQQLRITHFTPAVRPIFRLLSTDIGRPISDMNSQFSTTQYVEYAHHVLKTNETKEFEEHALDHTCYTIRISPYRSSKGKVEGIVMAFQDCTMLRNAQECATKIIETVTQPLVITDEQFRIVSKNEAFIKHFMKRSRTQRNGDISQIIRVPRKELNRLKNTLSKAEQSTLAKGQIESLHVADKSEQVRWTCMIRQLHYRPNAPMQLLMLFTKQEKG